MLWASGCGRVPLDQALIGTWSEDQVDRRVEFTPNRLYAVVTNGEPVDVGVWSVKGNEVSLESLIAKARTTWKCSFDDGELIIDGGKAFKRRFEKARRSSANDLFDKRLDGLWRSDDREPEVVEFTPAGTFVGMFQRLDEKKSLNRLGCWGRVSRESSSAFFLVGTMGSATMAGSLPHKFALEGNKLLWGGGRKRPPKVYRKVTPTDIQQMLARVPDAAATPASSATPKKAPVKTAK